MARISFGLAVLLLVGGACPGFRHGRAAADDAENDAAIRRTQDHHADVFENNEKLSDQRNLSNIEGMTRRSNTGDSNSYKIPSRADPSKSVGLLSPSEIELADQCFPKPECDESDKFRTIDGSCNNLQDPIWGKSFTANTRIIQADYSDGISEPRKAESGRDLPNARTLRTKLFPDADKPRLKHNLFVMQFGQILAHDTEEGLPKTSSDGDELECCNPDGSEPKDIPEDCLQITNDRAKPDSKKRCLSIPRAADTADEGCTIKPVRQQISVTSFIDASLLYGSDDDTAKSLRSNTNGRLRSQIGPKKESYLPNVEKASETCNVKKDNTVCYEAGDDRVNQHPDVAVETISLLRLHNALCDELSEINPSWNDERLYQEARSILIGMYQHVTYSEFIPELLGREFAKVNDLLPIYNGFDYRYNDELNPTTISSFTAAAFRALHSYIQGYVELYNEARKVTSKIRLSDYFERTDIVQRNDNYDSFIRGLLTQRAQEQDEYFTTEVSEYLFREPNETKGFDLISFDIERGRDYGLPSYNKFRQLCGLSEAKTFDDLTDIMSKKNARALSKVYDDVDDIDYYVGGILEDSKPGAILGHTFQCIVGEMFYRWKFGDRFYYEFGKQAGSFTLEQLDEIRKTSLALIVCMTSDIQSIQRKAFLLPSSQNPLVSCSSIPEIDLSVWKEA